MQAARILETSLYADDLETAEEFYRTVLGLMPFLKEPGRHVFFRLADQMLLIFNATATCKPPGVGALPVPPHGATGDGHLCFAATGEEIERWAEHLKEHGVEIESDFRWPSGQRSIYFRDPAGNSLEFTEPSLWFPA